MYPSRTSTVQHVHVHVHVSADTLLHIRIRSSTCNSRTTAFLTEVIWKRNFPFLGTMRPTGRPKKALKFCLAV